MSEIGYNGRAMTFQIEGVVVAALTNKTSTRNKEPVDVTTDDSSGWRIVLPDAGVRSFDASLEGVATEDNYTILRNAWVSDQLLDGTLVDADGTTHEPEHGWFFGNLEFTGETAGYVGFTVQLQSSGPIVSTPAST
jgi:predicted secreted protein